MKSKAQPSVESVDFPTPFITQIGLMSFLSLMLGSLLLTAAAIAFVVWPRSLVNEFLGWSGLAFLQSSGLFWVARKMAGITHQLQIHLRTVVLQTVVVLTFLNLNLCNWAGWFERLKIGWPMSVYLEYRHWGEFWSPFAAYVNLSFIFIALTVVYWFSEPRVSAEVEDANSC